jgi:hypothetical protein
MTDTWKFLFRQDQVDTLLAVLDHTAAELERSSASPTTDGLARRVCLHRVKELADEIRAVCA